MTTRRIPRAVLAAVWLCQVLALVGSGMTGFVLAVHVYQTTHSTSRYTLVELGWLLPLVVFSPWAGKVVDRFARRDVLMLADFAGAMAPLALGLVFRASPLGIAPIAATAAFLSTCAAVQWPALSALTVELVASEHLERANGVVELGRALAQVFAPLLAGFLAMHVPTSHVLFLDAGAHFLSAFVLFTSVPRTAIAALAPPGADSPVDAKTSAWQFLRRDPGLLSLTIFFAVANIALGTGEICLPPLVLNVAGPTSLGTVLWCGGVGMLIGGGLASVWRGTRHKAHLILALVFAQGTLLAFAGAQTRVALLAAAAGGFLFCTPLVNSANQTVWTTRVPQALQGRVLGLRRTIEASSRPLAAALAGPLVDRVIAPWSAKGEGAMAGAIGWFTGMGPGREVGILYFVVGAGLMAAVLVAALFPSLFSVNEEVAPTSAGALEASSS